MEVIHRPRTAVDLPAPAGSLFLMAGCDSSTVIYIIIAKQMKTQHNSSTIQNISDIGRSNRLALALAGIAIAIICSLVLFHDDHDSMSHGAVQLQQLVETSKTFTAKATVEVKNIGMVSTIRAVKW